MRVVDRNLLAEFRAARHCSWCGRPTPRGCDPAHALGRGAGGSDIRINLVALCRACHTDFHGGAFHWTALLVVAAHREGYAPADALAEIWRLRREPKENA